LWNKWKYDYDLVGLYLLYVVGTLNHNLLAKS